ncbi:MAG: permease-like cell division protein FtsX [Candidatus Uhrbacteria bacterium]|nr:permease-like cell division protein FtsX [Candidatus Uhrbacteria bacterium]
MKIFVHSHRVFLAAIQNIFRNAWLGIATVIVLVLALTSVNLLVGMNVLIGNAVKLLEQKIDVTVFFKQNANEALVTQAKFFLAELPQVQSVELLQADAALEQFRARHAADAEILSALDELDGNPLGATLRITARAPSDYPFIIDTLKNPQFTDAIESKTYDDHADAIASVRSIGDYARKIGAILIAIFSLIGMLIVFNSIRVAIYTQREEIGIMRLVGASSFFVRAPFVIQGIALAIIALGITAGFVAIGIAWMDPMLTAAYGGDPGLRTYFSQAWPRLALIEGGGLSLLIGVTSWLAAGKYLKR